MALRVLAIAAPHYQSGGPGDRVLTSADPVSLFNACRNAASAADQKVGAWADSNWVGARHNRRESFLLLHSVESDIGRFESALEHVRPQLLLIGAMSLCLPGAVECARRARGILGDRVAIVLGGWHATETIFRPALSERVAHHSGSPARLMSEGHLAKNTFDLVVSGEAAPLITRIGEIVATSTRARPIGRALQKRLHEVGDVPGNWIATFVDGGIVREVVGTAPGLAQIALPAPSALFGVRAAFDVFDGNPTAHVFSDSGRGCVYDCTFCSERLSAVGAPPALDGAPERLYGQMATAADVVLEDHPGRQLAAFVEDSVFLGGSTKAIERFISLARVRPLGVTFGCQFTIDQVLAKRHVLPALAEIGLSYVFVGLETSEPPAIGGLSKDVRPLAGWLPRMEAVLELLSAAGISCGVAVLFGLGEDQKTRLRLLALLARWREVFGSPHTISFNWAVQHPLRGHDGGRNYRYLEWGLPNDEWVEAFGQFGEASTLYPLAGRQAPVLSDVMELRHAIDALTASGGATRASELPAEPVRWATAGP